ncbi:N-acetyltransferase [Shewanella sp. Scap07]|uniref:GNAT family N-acetyltransferase n=1 Tax=Shewanella sp. Scap07 TaxID=2589987 RepID=UPI0015BD228C|nr:GNAT family N-acetyltransferase [Shewanella sp. Scap07]
MTSFQPTTDLLASAQITFDNMRSYYEHYSVDWQLPQIHTQIADLENWDIVYNGEIVGAIRLAYDSQGCYLRDLQVAQQFQNKGIGRDAIAEVKRLAIQAGANQLRLRVFKISPAVSLYQTIGFTIDTQEERFYYMSLKIVE